MHTREIYQPSEHVESVDNTGVKIERANFGKVHLTAIISEHKPGTLPLALNALRREIGRGVNVFVPEYFSEEFNTLGKQPVVGPLLHHLPQFATTNFREIYPYANQVTQTLLDNGDEGLKVLAVDPAHDAYFLAVRGLPVVISKIGIELATSGTVLALYDKFTHKGQAHEEISSAMKRIGVAVTLAGIAALVSKQIEFSITQKPFPYPSEAWFRRIVAAKGIANYIDMVNQDENIGDINMLIMNVEAHYRPIIELLNHRSLLDAAFAMCSFFKCIPTLKDSLYNAREYTMRNGKFIQTGEKEI
jgi:hypothetical protein